MPKLIKNEPTLWLGAEELYDAVLEAEERLAQLEARGPDAISAKCIELRGGKSDDMFALPELWSEQDGVAVLDINGPLVLGSAGFLRLFGVIGYDDIRDAAMEAMSRKSVKSLLLNVGSGGGMAAGCEDCSNTLKKLGSVKPIHTYTSSIMGSAAYWIGSVGAHIGTAKTATVGSIGAIQVHTEYSKQDEKQGITRTVMRAGEFKQRNNSIEPLTKEAKADIEAKLEQMYDVFADGVSSNLGMDRKKFDSTAGRGREFLGVEAVTVGLAHTLMSFDEALAYAKSVDSSKLSSQNSRNPKKDSVMKATLATQILLALAGGAAVATLDFTKAEANMSGEVPDAEGQTLLRAQAIEVRNALDAGQAAAIKAATDPITAELNTLKATHQTKMTELGALQASNTALVEQVNANKAVLDVSEKVLHGSLTAMCLSLQVAAPAADLKGPALSAEHARVEADFLKKFPQGKVTVMASADGVPPAKTAGSTALPDFVVTAQRNTALRNGANV